MNPILEFIKDKNLVKVAVTLSIFFLTIHFFLIGFAEINLLFDVFALGSYGLYRLIALILAFFFGVLTFAMYTHNKSLMDARIKSMKEKVSEESKNFANKVEDVLDSDQDEDNNQKVEDAEIVEKKTKNSAKKKKTKPAPSKKKVLKKTSKK